MQGAVTDRAELDLGFLGMSLEPSSSEGWGGGLEKKARRECNGKKGDLGGEANTWDCVTGIR